MKRSIIITALALACSSVLTAQEKGHYLTFDLGGGLHSMQYDPQDGSQSPSFGGTFNIGYHYFFNNHFGIATGVGISSLRSKAEYSFMESATAHDDVMGEDYELRTYYKNITEYQNLLRLDIPVAVNFQTPVSNKWKFLVAVGGKLHLPVWNEYKLTDGEYETRGYYSSTNVEYANLPQHGFTTTQADDQSGDLNLKDFSVSIFSDLGFSYKIKPHTELYLGVYVDYDVTDITDGGNSNLFSTDNYCGTFASNQIDGAKGLSAGIKIGLGLHLGAKAKKHTAQPVYQTLTPAPAPDTVKTVETVKTEPKPAQPAAVYNRKAAADTISTCIHFEKDKAEPEMGDSVKTVIKNLSNDIKNDSSANILIVGHTCSLGSSELNMVVGQNRADAVKAEFVKNGVPSSSITTTSKGESQPVATNLTSAGRHKNRRVEIFIK